MLNYFAHVFGLYSVGVNVQQALLLWERPLHGRRGVHPQSQQSTSELDLKRRYILNSIRLKYLERGGLSPRTAASLPNQAFSDSIAFQSTDQFDQLRHIEAQMVQALIFSIKECNKSGSFSGEWQVAHHFNGVIVPLIRATVCIFPITVCSIPSPSNFRFP